MACFKRQRIASLGIVIVMDDEPDDPHCAAKQNMALRGFEVARSARRGKGRNLQDWWSPFGTQCQVSSDYQSMGPAGWGILVALV